MTALILKRGSDAGEEDPSTSNDLESEHACIYRHLGGLRAMGLIETLEQERKSRTGRISISRIRLTRKGALGLGLENV